MYIKNQMSVSKINKPNYVVPGFTTNTSKNMYQDK